MGPNVPFGERKTGTNRKQTTRARRSVIPALTWPPLLQTARFSCSAPLIRGRPTKGLLNAEGWAEWIADDIKIQGDWGGQGLQNESVNGEMPHKKPKGDQFSDGQKAENHALTRERGVGEHAFADFKRYGIAPQVYRNRKDNFDDRSIFTAAGL
jgi:hypothetical protein